MIIASLKELRPVPSTLQLKHPITGELVFTGDNEPLTITMVGQDSTQVFDEVLLSAKRRAEAGEHGKTTEFDIAERHSFITAAITGWSHDDFFGGKFSKKKIAEFVRDPENAALVGQIEVHLLERANFFAK
ncbi:hypothetical protein [Acidovorax sp.]|uniref:hypothetical protein n=1 Tax=Acidovorax sp. TaxID=1872122 RepID=UPI00391F0726